MKKKLLSLLFCALGFATIQAQTISIVGTGVNGWPGNQVGDEITLSTTDNVTYTIDNLVVNTGEVKFRQDFAWDTNWGSSSWPAGTGTQNGNNIPTIAGTYDVTFNRTTGAYSFTGSSAFESVGIWGPAVDPVNGFNGGDIEMLTNDGIQYRLSGYTFTSGAAKFRINDNPLETFGAVDFPSGTATEDGPNILVEGGTWTVFFNLETGAYTFAFPSIGLIGSATGSWDVDQDMATTNGELYTLQNVVLVDGEIKFRQDDAWTVNWGGGGANPNVLVFNGSNIAVTAGTYDITFNRITLEWTITPSLNTAENSAQSFRVFPNPSRSTWNFMGNGQQIDAIAIYDVSGKVVYTATPAASETTIDASEFASGMYIAKISAQGAVQHVRLVRQ